MLVEADQKDNEESGRKTLSSEWRRRSALKKVLTLPTFLEMTLPTLLEMSGLRVNQELDVGWTRTLREKGMPRR